jgi:hypothetical protein
MSIPRHGSDEFSASRRKMPRHVGVEDREFTVFQFAGLLGRKSMDVLPQAFERFPASHALKPDDFRDTTMSYIELRRILETSWYPEDRAKALFTHASGVHVRGFGSVGLASLGIQNARQRMLFCGKNFRAPWTVQLEEAPGDTLRMMHFPKFYDPEMKATLELFHFVNCLSVFRSHVPITHAIERVGLTATVGVSKSALEDFFACPVHFDADVAYCLFTREAMAMRTVPSVIENDERRAFQQLCETIEKDADNRGQTLLQFLFDQWEKFVHLRNLRGASVLAEERLRACLGEKARVSPICGGRWQWCAPSR